MLKGFRNMNKFTCQNLTTKQPKTSSGSTQNIIRLYPSLLRQRNFFSRQNTRQTSLPFLNSWTTHKTYVSIDQKPIFFPQNQGSQGKGEKIKNKKEDKIYHPEIFFLSFFLLVAHNQDKFQTACSLSMPKTVRIDHWFRFGGFGLARSSGSSAITALVYSGVGGLIHFFSVFFFF